MSQDDNGYRVGPGKPPLNGRFTSERQPARRRGRRRNVLDHDVVGHLAKLLNEPVTVTVAGKKVSMSKAEALATNMINGPLKNGFDDQLKAFQLFAKLGLLDGIKADAAENAELREELEAARDRLDAERTVGRAVRHLNEMIKGDALEIMRSFEVAHSRCTCGAMHGTTGAQQKLAEWRAEQEADIEHDRRLADLRSRTGVSEEEILEEILRGGGVIREVDARQKPDDEPERKSGDDGNGDGDGDGGRRNPEDPDDEFYSGMLR
jgi:hypothetical protein